MDIITYEILFNVLKKLLTKSGMKVEEIKELTYYVINFFGYGDQVVDNILTPADRHVFNTLEELGVLKTRMEEINVARGKLWRIHYWVYRKENIEKLLEESDYEEDEGPEELYKKLFEEEK